MSSLIKKYAFKFLLCICILINIFSGNVFAVDKNNFYTKDEIGCVSEEVKEYIAQVNSYYETTNEKPQVVVNMISSLNDETIETYAVKKFEELKIGNAEFDNGVLVVISTENRNARIEVGYGLEGVITDSLASEMLKDVTNYFEEEDYNSAIKYIFDGIAKNINKEYGYIDMEERIGVSLDSYNEYNNYNEYEKLTKTEIIVYSIFFVVSVYLFIRYEWFRELVACMLFQAVKNENNSRIENNKLNTTGLGGRSGGGGSSINF